ncbi:MAG: hypothetical protein ACYDBB_14780 [Armatimonadota bacterium]
MANCLLGAVSCGNSRRQQWDDDLAVPWADDDLGSLQAKEW